MTERAVTIDFLSQPPLRNFLNHKPDSSFVEYTNVGGQRRFYAHAGGVDTGFIAVAAWDATVALSTWRRTATMIAGGTLAAVIVITGLFLSAIREVRRRQARDSALRQSQEDLARAQRIANLGSFSRNLVTGQVEWSEEFLKIWGPKEGAHDLTADFLGQFVHPEDRAKFISVRDIPLADRTGLALDFRMTRPDGQERILHREYGIIFDEQQRPLRSFGIVQDITDRKRAEIELRRSRANMAQAQKIAAIGSFERDLITDKTEWSDEMYQILGFEKGEVAASYQILVERVHPEDRDLFAAARNAAAKGETTGALEFRIVRPDGVERRIRRETGIVFDDEMRPIRFYGSYQDITERRDAEARERELERQLLHSQKLEALGTLAGGIAHDLNNTLVPIMALSKITARRLEAGSTLRANLETIFEASERARDLVKRVVSFSRRDPSERRDTNMTETVNEALKLLRATIPSSICLETRIAEVPSILGDSSQIHQVVTNLLSNAAQAIGADIGKITVELAVVTSASGQSDIRLSVSDTGVGMDEITQQRIFEPFFTTKSVGQGTGLGLSIVHGIVTGHGGRIAVESAPGKGTRFELYFPVTTGETAAEITRPAA
jgi:PAS domain S-box-containing protein